jgi:uncharacterized alkaline shock family protein YloU
MSTDAVGGVTIVTRTAARRLIAALAAADLGVPARGVDVRLTDERARWRVDVTSAARREADRSVNDAAETVRRRVLRDVPRLAGAEVGRVTVRITALHDERTRTS